MKSGAFTPAGNAQTAARRFSYFNRLRSPHFPGFFSAMNFPHPSSRKLLLAALAAGLVLTSWPTGLHAQVPLSPDEGAAVVLNAGRRAYNEKQFPVAAERFREFLKVAPNHKDAPAGRYGLGLALLEAGDVKGALEAFTQAAGAEFPERPLALYFTGAAHRLAGTQTLAQIAAKPNEEAALRAAAAVSFGAAAKFFQQAAEMFTARWKKPEGEPPPVLPIEGEWLVRARCDQAEMLLRTGKAKEAGDLAWTVLNDPAWTKSRNRPLAAYHFGHANFLQKEYVLAGRELSQLAPFAQEFGVHARYLLARAHHLSGELAEAGGQYKAVLAGYDERKKTAQPALQNPVALVPEQKAALEALVQQPPPEHVARTEFYSAVLAFDEGKQTDAAAMFAAFAQKYPKSALLAEAQFRIGACNVQLKKWPEANAALDPLKEHPQLADQALTWLARAKIGAADPAKPAEFNPAAVAALDLLRRAAAKVQPLAATDPDAKIRRAGILMELADTAVLAKLFPEAVTNYDLVSNEKLDRAEEAMQRQVTARHLAAQHPEAEAAAVRFEQTYPASTLLPVVLFRAAESAYLRAVKTADPNGQKAALAEAVARYKRIVRKYPDFPHINMARHGLATSLYRLGNHAEAALTFATIPDPDRSGDLADAPYLLADCLMRGFPAETDDAIQAARFIQQAEQAAKLLDVFTGANPQSPQAADALLKLGYCQQRVGLLLAAPADRTKALTAARDAYDKAMKLTDKEPVRSVAVFELAKCQALLGDAATSAALFAQFQNAPLNATPNAPLALLRLSVLQRAQGKTAEAVNIMTACRAQHEAKLAADPARAPWVPMIQYEHALALKESGKLPEARAQFEALAKAFVGKPEGLNAEWRLSQCKREETAALIATARTAAANPGANPEQFATALKALETQTDALRDSADGFLVQAEQLRPQAGGSDAHLRMLYEAAWSFRLISEVETEPAKLIAQRPPVVAAPAPAGTPAKAPAAAPSPAPAARPPAEKRAIEVYQKIIAAASAASVATQARSELAELFTARGDTDTAAELLTESLQHTPAGGIPGRIRLGLAAANIARKAPAQALANVQPLLAAPDSPDGIEARTIVGEALIQQQNWPKAIEQLLPFRDDGKLHNIAGVSDRAVLRLAFAYSQSAQWAPARQTLETLLQRYPQSPWIDEARYTIGWVWQNQKNYDAAVAAFSEVTKRTTAEIAAKAQLQIGLCRLEQKRWEEAAAALVAVTVTYAYPELVAAARCEAARAHLELLKPAEAKKQWQQVLNESPKSPWADVARKGLEGLK